MKKRQLMLFLILFAAHPLLAQKLYSYRDANGRLVITDKPVVNPDKKDLKLVKTYEPLPERERMGTRNRSDNARISRNAGLAKGKYVLTNNQIEGLVNPVARSMKVDPELVKAVIMVESSRNARALSSKGAVGLMQLMPATAERFGVQNAWDPRQNVRGGVAYLRYLLSYFKGDVDLVLAAYNAGENAVDRHKGIPPYKETQRYVVKIRKYYGKKQVSYDDRVAPRKSVLVSHQPETADAPQQVAAAVVSPR